MAANSFDLPGNAPLTDGNAATPSWLQWFTRVHSIVTAQQQSGITANRPTKGLWIGRRYYDTTLNVPVYVAQVNPTVWRNASGAVA